MILLSIFYYEILYCSLTTKPYTRSFCNSGQSNSTPVSLLIARPKIFFLHFGHYDVFVNYKRASGEIELDLMRKFRVVAVVH
jgi:hypothetical protein